MTQLSRKTQSGDLGKARCSVKPSRKTTLLTVKPFQTPRLNPGEEEDDDEFWSRRKNGILTVYPTLLAKVRQIVCAV